MKNTITILAIIALLSSGILGFIGGRYKLKAANESLALSCLDLRIKMIESLDTLIIHKEYVGLYSKSDCKKHINALM